MLLEFVNINALIEENKRISSHFITFSFYKVITLSNYPGTCGYLSHSITLLTNL